MGGPVRVVDNDDDDGDVDDGGSGDWNFDGGGGGGGGGGDEDGGGGKSSPNDDDGEDLVREVLMENPPEEKGVRDEWAGHVGWHRKENVRAGTEGGKRLRGSPGAAGPKEPGARGSPGGGGPEVPGARERQVVVEDRGSHREADFAAEAREAQVKYPEVHGADASGGNIANGGRGGINFRPPSSPTVIDGEVSPPKLATSGGTDFGGKHPFVRNWTLVSLSMAMLSLALVANALRLALSGRRVFGWIGSGRPEGQRKIR